MAYSNGIVTKPVRTQDVAQALGVASSKVTVLCAHEKINKWSMNKPIRHTKITALTDWERMGTTADRAAGIYYGLKLAVVSQIGDMHSASFEYQRVRPGTDPARLGDFNGYDHKAVPNPQGVLPSVAYVDLPHKDADIQLNYSTTNTTGVNLNDIISTSVSNNDTLGSYYPCVLVTLGTDKWVRALWNANFSLDSLGSDKNAGYTTFQYSNQWITGWKLLMDTDSENGTKEQPNFTDGATMTVTVFFMRSIGQVSGVSTDGNPNMRKWTKVNTLMSTNTGYACPGAVAQTIQLKNYYTKGLRLSGASWTYKANTSNKTMTINMVVEWLEPKSGETYTLTGTVIDSSGMSIGLLTYDFIYPASQGLIHQTDISVTAVGLSNSAALRIDWTVKVGSQLRNSGSTTMSHM